MAAAATFNTLQLLDKPGAPIAIWTVKPLIPKHHCANGVTKHVWPRVKTLPTWQNT